MDRNRPMKGEGLKFDEFSMVLLGSLIFMGILAIALTTPSEFPPKVSPSEINLNLEPGDVTTFSFNVSGKVTKVNATATGRISSWMKLSKEYIGVLTGPPETIEVSLRVPASAQRGTHTGKIIVFGKEGHIEITVNIFISSIKRLQARNIHVEDFSVRYLSEKDIVASSERDRVTKSYFSEGDARLVGVVQDDRLPIVSGGTVKFIVEETNNYGPIIVTQNGVDVFKEIVGPGEVSVPLRADKIGKNNVILIRGDGPGVFFWAENVYLIRDAEFTVEFEGPIPNMFNFTLSPEEQEKFDHLQMTFVAGDSSDILTSMKIKLNSQLIYSEVPTRTIFNRNFEKDLLGNSIMMKDENSFVFSFDRESFYKISDPSVTIFTRA